MAAQIKGTMFSGLNETEVDFVNEMIHIGNSEISVKEYNGQRVVTFKDIDTVHGRPEGTARKRFADNKDRFIEGEDFFKVCPSEIRTAKLFDIPDKATTDYALITEQGYLMLVKSFTDDLAWEVQRSLVNTYFRAKTERSELSPQLQLIYAMADNQARVEMEQKRLVEQARRIEQKVETIQNIMVEPIGDWRNEINKRVRDIAISCNMPYQTLYDKMYAELETAAHCSLKRLQDNKTDRMKKAGNTKTAIKNETTKIAIIEEKPQLKAIFESIVKRYAMAYC